MSKRSSNGMAKTMKAKTIQDLWVYAGSESYTDQARSLADRLGIPVVDALPDPESDALGMMIDDRGLALVGGGQTMYGDFGNMLNRLKPGNMQQEILPKAAKIKGLDHMPVVFDATAGMGEDSLLLAAAGFQVIMYEYDPVIAVLLEDTLRRSAKDPVLGPIVAKMEFHQGDSIAALKSGQYAPDVVLLDPMFPQRQKNAAVKKKFQLMQQLERPCSEEEPLLEAALSVQPRKIVIKRPVKGPYLAGRKPDYSLGGKAIRYDCLVFARNKEIVPDDNQNSATDSKAESEVYEKREEQ